MNRDNPKMILNVSFENAELEEKVKIAMDAYVEKIILKNLEDAIKRIIDAKIDNIVRGGRFGNEHKICGMSLHEYVNAKTEKTIGEVIEANAKRILAEKLAKLI